MKYVATILDASSLARFLRAKGLPTHIDPIKTPRPPPPSVPTSRDVEEQIICDFERIFG